MNPSPRFGKPSAFSLVEMLVVITIMVILMALVMPATSSIFRSMNLNRAITMITDDLNLARQTALSRNRDVEVRFYRTEAKSDGKNPQFRAYQSFLADGSDPTKSQPITKLKYLPETIVISDNVNFSSLLDYTNANRSGLTYSNAPLSGGAGVANYVSFLFRANGSTSLKPVNPPLGNWYITLHSENGATNPSTGLPDNYYTAQVDPVTGRLRSYRP